jgi:hypothetical protein
MRSSYSDEGAVTELRENMTESQALSVPVYQEYMNPLVEVLRSQGQALRIEELDRLVKKGTLIWPKNA